MTFITNDEKSYITNKLENLAQEKDIKILFAIESGSRLWGFPSKDSDFDVRFVYAKPLKKYLSVSQEKDVIEIPINDDIELGVPLDLNGWDIKKTLNLAKNSNRALIEWIQSDIIYVNTEISTQLKNCVLTNADLPAIYKHYIGWAKNLWLNCVGTNIRVKTYCYVLRAILSADFIMRKNTVPPPNINDLLLDEPHLKEIKNYINNFLNEKIHKSEDFEISRLKVFDQFIVDKLNQNISTIKSTTLLDNNFDAIFQKAIGFN